VLEKLAVQVDLLVVFRNRSTIAVHRRRRAIKATTETEELTGHESTLPCLKVTISTCSLSDALTTISQDAHRGGCPRHVKDQDSRSTPTDYGKRYTRHVSGELLIVMAST
jgi:hypothetical protein